MVKVRFEGRLTKHEDGLNAGAEREVSRSPPPPVPGLRGRLDESAIS